MFFDILFIVYLLMALTSGLLTGYIASANGRSFWRWFAVGCALPYVSLLLITAVVFRGQRYSRP